MSSPRLTSEPRLRSDLLLILYVVQPPRRQNLGTPRLTVNQAAIRGAQLRVPRGRGRSRPQVEDAKQRKQPPRGGVVDRRLAGQPLDQQFRALVVQRAPAGVDRLDLRDTAIPNRLV